MIFSSINKNINDIFDIDSEFSKYFDYQTNNNSGIASYFKDDTIQIALPGFSKEDIEIEAIGNILTVFSNVKESDETEFKQSFTKSFKLDPSYDTDSIKASMVDCILSINLSKNETKRNINIK